MAVGSWLRDRPPVGKKTMVGEEGVRKAKPWEGVRKGDLCPWLMDPCQLLHNFDQVICSGLSLHATAIVVL